MEKVLNICSNFLKDHDSETIIIHLKNENTCFGLNVDINYKKDRECVSETNEIIKDQNKTAKNKYIINYINGILKLFIIQLKKLYIIIYYLVYNNVLFLIL